MDILGIQMDVDSTNVKFLVDMTIVVHQRGMDALDVLQILVLERDNLQDY